MVTVIVTRSPGNETQCATSSVGDTASPGGPGLSQLGPARDRESVEGTSLCALLYPMHFHAHTQRDDLNLRVNRVCGRAL